MDGNQKFTIIRAALSLLALGCGLFANPIDALSPESELHWIQIRAKDSRERSAVANQGIAIEMVREDYVTGVGTKRELDALLKQGVVIRSTTVSELSRDFPQEDSQFHNYAELTDELRQWAQSYPQLVRLDSLGQSVEGKEIWHLTLTDQTSSDPDKPSIALMGGHHAREHLSVETPYLIAKELITKYMAGDNEVRRLLRDRVVHIIPVVNPDGKEYDITGGEYHYWRKNRAAIENRRVGVDLNRNYDLAWGTTGASPDPNSETYRGPTPFSEPESRAIKQYVEKQRHLTILVSFHTFSELILYPWGHTDQKLENERDLAVHKTMAETMARWNGYQPMQSADLYLASGDTTDWSYGVHGIISFTFELDPRDGWSEGGFYPGAGRIQSTFAKNWRPVLYLIDLADNPYRVLDPTYVRYGLRTPLIN